MNFSLKRFLQLLFITLDLLFLNVAYLLAQSIFQEDTESAYYLRYAQFWMIINGFWLALSWLGGVYATSNISFFEKFFQAGLRIYILWAVLVIIYLFLPRVIALSSPMVFTTVFLFLTGLIINRFIYLAIRQFVKREIHLKRKVLILGYNSTARKFATYLEREGLGFQIMGYIDDKKNTREVPKYPVYDGLADTLATAKQLQVNEVYSTIMPENNSKVYKLMQQADKELVRFRLVADFCQFINRPVHADFFHDIPLLSIRREPLEQVMNRFQEKDVRYRGEQFGCRIYSFLACSVACLIDKARIARPCFLCSDTER
jgi:putative colanic acid biosynthesis UDP-glucose lipid carrier transferase